jgi:molybdopterin synthase sulfur carrier subunit
MTRLLFFGRLKDVAGGELIVDLPEHVATVAELRRWLADSDAELGAALQAHGIHVVIDQVIRNGAAVSVRGAREVAFMPPLSGG